MTKEPFMSLFIWSYFTSLGIILGGSLIGAFAGFLIGKSPCTLCIPSAIA